MASQNSSLKDLLTNERILKAFEKTVQEIIPKEGKLILISPDRFTETLAFMRDSFFKDEPVSKALGMPYDSQFEAYIASFLSPTLSLMLINQDNNEVMGVYITTYSNRDDEMNAEDFNNEMIRKKLTFYHYTEQQSNYFTHYDTKEVINIYALGIAEKYRRRGLGELLATAALNFLRNLEIYPLYLKVEGNSNYSNRIFKKLGFNLLAEVMYDSYKVDGEILLKDTGDHKSLKLYGMVITKT